MALKSRYLVTAALPYANGRLHVGHVAGAYLPADIFVRYLRLAGVEVRFVCGSDENGAPITYSAMKEGVEPQAIVDRYHASIKDAFEGLGVSFDIYGRTHTPAHDAVSQEFFTRLLERGHVVRRAEEQVYCTECGMFLPDRYIEGVCPHPGCGAPDARGDQCERCGRPVDATKLGDPRCMVCAMRGRPDRGHIEVRKTDNWYFELEHFQDELSRFIAAHPEWRESVRRFSDGMLKQGLRARCITRDLDWGVPVPLAEGRGKVLYVWFDAPIGYVTFTREFFAARGEPERWRDFWCDPQAGLVHFIGKDNTVFHTIIFPGMLLGHGDYRLPDAVVTNEFLNIEGDKLSTSRDRAVWVDDFLKEFPPDALRYYLCAIAPETADADFSWRQFQALANGVLADNLGNFIQRNLTFCQKYFDGVVPPADEPDDDFRAVMDQRDAAREAVGGALERYEFKAGLEAMLRLSRAGNEYFSRVEPWKSRKTDMAACGRAIHAGLSVVEALSVLMAPFLPFASERLRGQLGLPALGGGDWRAPWRLAAGHRIGAPEVLFPKIDDGRMAAHFARWEKKGGGG